MIVPARRGGVYFRVDPSPLLCVGPSSGRRSALPSVIKEMVDERGARVGRCSESSFEVVLRDVASRL